MLVFLEYQGIRHHSSVSSSEKCFSLKTPLEARLISQINEFCFFPVLFKTIIQLRDLATDIIGQRIQDELLQQAKGKRKESDVAPGLSPSWKKYNSWDNSNEQQQPYSTLLHLYAPNMNTRNNGYWTMTPPPA
ncbi:unnamed protein product [Absidia cylindrospora]